MSHELHKENWMYGTAQSEMYAWYSRFVVLIRFGPVHLLSQSVFPVTPPSPGRYIHFYRVQCVPFAI